MFKKIKLPSGKLVTVDMPIYHGSYFNWGEALNDLKSPIQTLFHDDRMVCRDLKIEENILRMAKYLDEVREVLGGRPLIVRSWYRTDWENRRAGSTLSSYHPHGLAVDFISDYISPSQIYDLLDNWHGDKGGLGRYYSLIHLDLQGELRRWNNASNLP